MQQVLSAVNYMHNCGIIYRDIKPENIVFNNKPIVLPNGQKSPSCFDIIKIVDFGTADYWKNDFLSEPFGSISSMAPEMLKRKYDLKVDIWSCGVVLFSMLMMRLPFDGVGDEDVLKSIKTRNIVWTAEEF